MGNSRHKKHHLEKLGQAIHKHNKKRFDPIIKQVSPRAETDTQGLRPFRIGRSRIGRNSTLGGGK